MIISLLDGFMVALKFDLPHELGSILNTEKRNKIFRLKYGIELGNIGSGRRLVDDKSGPKLIENILQYEMEESDGHDDEDVDNNSFPHSDTQAHDTPMESVSNLNSSRQIESVSKSGKKRIQPVLLNQNDKDVATNSAQASVHNRKSKPGNVKSKLGNKEGESSVSSALKLAEEAAAIAEGVSGRNANQGNVYSQTLSINEQGTSNSSVKPALYLAPGVDQYTIRTVVPPKRNQSTFSIELQSSWTPSSMFLDSQSSLSSSTKATVIAKCINSVQSPPGFDSRVPFVTLSISRNADMTWKDHIIGSHCTSLAGCSSLLAVGTFDGTVYLYGTSPTTGWDSGIGFRSHAPIVMNSSIVHLHLQEKKDKHDESVPNIEMLVLTSDGAFGVYCIMPVQKLLYKGSISAPMTQMCLSASSQQQHGNVSLPELGRIFITESQHLFLVLCHSKSTRLDIGGAVQGFVYNRDMEVWTRVSDERFLCSNFFTTVPTSRLSRGLLATMDETVKGSLSGNQANRRGMMKTSAASIYYLNDDDEHSFQSYMTRAHCEDRLACALALQSQSDFKHWLLLYVRQLCVDADSNQLRFLVDVLLYENSAVESEGNEGTQLCWWLQSGQTVLDIDKRHIVEKIIIPEMSKNRSLQRLLNELSTELNLI